MKKVIVGSLAFLLTVSASAVNWLYVDTDKLGVDNYIDANSLRVIDRNSQIVTIFVRMEGIDKSNLKLKGSVVSVSSFKFAYSCRDESMSILSNILYDINGVVLHSESKPLSFESGNFVPLHPTTSSYLNMYAACAIAGFKDISNLL